jgi:hypothetical protein
MAKPWVSQTPSPEAMISQYKQGTSWKRFPLDFEHTTELFDVAGWHVAYGATVKRVAFLDKVSNLDASV